MTGIHKTFKSLHQVLLESGRISKDKLDKVLSTQPGSPEELGRRLIDLGLVSETVLLETLGEYLGIPFISLKDFPVREILREVYEAV
jgi:hypothetical protein